MTTTFLDFTGVYEDYDLSGYGRSERIDLQGIRGTDMYCDDNARRLLMDQISPRGPYGIHFLDSGNYHYMSRLYTDLLAGPFSLVVFDNHTDMQVSMIEELLSCGSWLRSVLKRNPHLCTLLLIGPPEGALETDLSCLFRQEKHGGQLSDSACPLSRDQILTISREELSSRLPAAPPGPANAGAAAPGDLSALLRLFPVLDRLDKDIPVYLSIDKDVLSEDWACTNWDQGQLSLPDLLLFLDLIGRRCRILGADICGERGRLSYTDPDTDKKADPVQASLVNKRTNSILCQFLRSMDDSFPAI